MYPWQCKDCPPGIICKNGTMELCPSDRPFSEWGEIIFEVFSHQILGISSDEQCQSCLNGFDCSPGKPRKLCPEGTYKKEVNFTNEPYELKFDLEHYVAFEKYLNNSGWANYDCIDCDPGMYCLGFERLVILTGISCETYKT